MSVKLNFKLDRTKFNHTHGVNMNQTIKNELEKCFTTKRIQFLRIYFPSHKYIKVLLSSEKLVKEIFNVQSFFHDSGFDPSLTMQLKTARTVFCFGFDTDLLRTHESEALKQLLIDAEWEVETVYILQSMRSMKIEFKSRDEAHKFIQSDNVNIGGIRLEKQHREPEVDPSIDQCYNCGALDPGHTRDACPNRLCCLRCGYQGHAFYECHYIPNIPPSQYSEHHKSQAYCIACASASGHCSLNHRACPTKKNIIKKRILSNRANRTKTEEETNTNSNISKQIAQELTNMDMWPKLPSSTNNLNLNSNIAMSAIITLAMVEEAHSEGSFQASLDKACEENNFPKFKYNINHQAAVMVVNNLCANPSLDNSRKSKQKLKGKSLSQPTPKSRSNPNLRALRSVRDMQKHLEVSDTELDSEPYVSESNGSQKRRRISPLKTNNVGSLNEIRDRLESQSYIINTENVSEVSNQVEEIAVNDLLTLYETANAELSATKRQIIEGLLKQAVDMDKDMKVNANIIRVTEDFH